MEITEIRIKLMDDSEDRLRAFCSITFDHAFVIRDLKIIEGNNGPFVAMPSRKLTSHCPKCKFKNYLRARFCNQCGCRLPEDQVEYDPSGRAKLYADVAHPINAECREQIQSRVVKEFELELERAKLPGYTSRYDDSYESGVTTRKPKRPELDEPVSDELERIDPAHPEMPSAHRVDQEKASVTDAASKTPDAGQSAEPNGSNDGGAGPNSG
ncbi:MAG TPA: SpoVG family protein [Pirellulaceae bacterium]|nr:SpoVG family protein [Pirellulaceae bacterium]HMO91559.1 SpoVG family protein [Pirellulaceae bacterium]HMP68256.1 SpoVG family protein [Pirellulaceae bacterium]